jgi:enterochelin esterase family protein
VASLSAAYRAPDTYGALALMSGSFVFTDIAGADHGGGPVFDPVVKFVNRYRARPRRVADRLFVSCGVFEPLITPNRSMVPTFEAAGMTVRFHESRDGHTWENWRDSLRDALAWVFPGPQKMIYE